MSSRLKMLFATALLCISIPALADGGDSSLSNASSSYKGPGMSIGQQEGSSGQQQGGGRHGGHRHKDRHKNSNGDNQQGSNGGANQQGSNEN